MLTVPAPSDFRSLRTGPAPYLDRTRFLLEVLEEPAPLLFFLRPPGFGKTLLLSMMRSYLEPGAEEELFHGTRLEASGRAQRWHGRHPVIHLAFPECDGDLEAIHQALRQALADAFRDHLELLREGLNAEETGYFERILAAQGTLEEEVGALRFLSRGLHTRHGQPVVVLVDDYDLPLGAALAAGSYDRGRALVRRLLEGALRDNPHLLKAVVMGTLRFPLEPLGLGAARVFDLREPRFAPFFGLLEDEVRSQAGPRADSAPETGPAPALADLRRWCDGYVMGGLRWYAPGPTLEALRRGLPLPPPSLPAAFDHLLRELLFERGLDLVWDQETLLAGGTVEHRVDEPLLQGSSLNPAAVWAALLSTGHLTAEGFWHEPTGVFGALRVPGLRARAGLAAVFSRWLEQAVGGREAVTALIRALLAGDVPALEHTLQGLTGRLPRHQPHDRRRIERLYQALIPALRVSLEPTHEARTERSSGYWSYDVLIRPVAAGGTGVVLVMRVPDVKARESASSALDAALERLERRGYAEELRQGGAARVHKLALVIDDRGVPSIRVRAAASRGRAAPSSP